MRRLRSWVGLLAVGAMLAAAGCSGSTPGGGGDGGNEGVGPITFAAGKDTSQGAQMKGLVDAWNRMHPDQEVTFLELPEAADQQRAQMVTTAQAKSGDYDVMDLDVIWTAEFAKAGYIQEIDQSEIDVEAFLKGPLETVTFEGKMWAVPSRSDGGLLYYRKDILDKEGMQPPATWADLIAMAKQLGPKYDIGGYAGQFAQYEGLTVNAMEAVWGAGGEALADSGSRVVVDSPQAREGLGLLASGFTEGWIPDAAITYKEEESRRAFQQGDLLFLRNWPYVFAQASADPNIKDKFGVAKLPGPSALGGHNLAISAFSENQKTAMDFIKFFTSEESQRVLFEKAAFPATRSAIYDDPEIQDKYPYSTVLRATIEGARSRPVTPYYNDVSLAIQEEAYAALQQRKSPDQAISDLAGRLETAIQGG